MNLTSLQVSGFCGIASELEFDLNARIVILAGRNGLGKTTVCDAIIWVLTGTHPRGAEPQNVYTSTPATVTLSGSSGVGSWKITRTARASGGELAIQHEGSALQGLAAQEWLDRELFPHQDLSESVAGLLSDSVYLQQETLRAFLSSKSDDERFAGLARMVGARRLSQFVDDFDSERRRWSKSIKAREEEVAAAELGLQSLRSDLISMEAQLGEAAMANDGPSWDSWVHEVTMLSGAPLPESVTDREIARLTSALSRTEAKLVNDLSRLDVLGDELAVAPTRVDGLAQDSRDRERSRVESASRALHNAEAAAAQAEAVAAEARSRVRALELHQQQMAQLADLALELLGSHCPVCDQVIDPQAVSVRLRRLRSLDENLDLADAAGLSASLQAASEAGAQRDMCLAELQSARAALQRIEEEYQREAIQQETRERILRDLGLTPGDGVSEQIGRRRLGIQGALDRIHSLRATATGFSEQIQMEGMRRRLDAGRAQLAELNSDLTDRRDDLHSAQRTARVATEVSANLKHASDELVSRRLEEIQPLLDHLYAAVDPHPTFRSIRLATRVYYGHPRLDPVVADDEMGIEIRDPSLTLSTSQSNALAVAIFLAFSLGLSPSSLDTLLLDDPLQNLDDVHLLGLVDVLRHVRSRRQLIVTAHDKSFARLLARKLRATSSTEAVLVHEIESWARSGPRVRTSRLPGSDRPFVFADEQS
ncbi:AAA family ATPase [Micropruina glycogenica]|uniref:Nuclease SbcCD subunit C n=1 Tax=Micropruina glycogenica TaxID=75385 RepID=A0A2N9JD30_9ACTN|nr:ATP-binding protein [Micropruina glycogenica]SPD86041.1 putative DNA double-strand break repair Rad50 ATPase [Micropruina glycogenica]